MARVFAKLATSFQPNLQVSFHTSQTSALSHLREHTKQMLGLGICSKVNITYRPNWQHELEAEGGRQLALNLSLSDQRSSDKKTIDFQSNKKEVLASQVRSLARELELNRHHLAHLFLAMRQISWDEDYVFEQPNLPSNSLFKDLFNALQLMHHDIRALLYWLNEINKTRHY